MANLFDMPRSADDANRRFNTDSEMLLEHQGMGLDKLTHTGIRIDDRKAQELLALARFTGDPEQLKLAEETFKVFRTERNKRDLAAGS